MTRSFGDTVAHSVGCNAEPEMGEYSFSKDDKVVVIASDGVWEFLENIDVARIVYPFYLQKNAEGAAENLVRASFKRWRKEESVMGSLSCQKVLFRGCQAGSSSATRPATSGLEPVTSTEEQTSVTLVQTHQLAVEGLRKREGWRCSKEILRENGHRR